MRLKAIISHIVSFCLLLAHLAPGMMNTELALQDSVRVAYLGIHFGEVDADMQMEIDEDLFLLINSETRLFTIPRETIVELLDDDLLQRLKTDPQDADLQTAAGLLEADYIFTGSLENPSNDPEYTALVGDVIRYDVASNQLYTLRIQSFYEDFNAELSRIYTQLIQSIVPAQKKSFYRKYLPGILIVAATAVVVTIFMSGTDGQGNGEGPGPIAP